MTRPRRAPALVTVRPATRSALGAASALVVTAVMAGCAGADTPPTTQVRLTAGGFDPVLVEAPAGTEVRFVNRSQQPQQVSSLLLDDGTAVVPPGAAALDSGRLVEGATYAARLDVPGQYVVEAVLAGSGNPAVVTIEVQERP